MKNFPLQSKYQHHLLTFRAAAIRALQLTQPLPVAMAFYAVLRAGVRFFGYALPGQCTNSVINLTLSTGTCIAAGNWLDTRVSWATSAHAWSWVMYGSFALMVALWARPRGSFNGWTALMLTGFIIAVHELIWFGTYFAVNRNWYDDIINLQIYGPFMATAGIGVVLFFLLEFHKKLDMKVFYLGMGAVFLYYLAWASIGYPLTLDLVSGDAPPALFGNLMVDFIEFGSWLIAFSSIGLSYYVKQSRDFYFAKIVSSSDVSLRARE